ncbi:hypothetical protein HMF7854_10210 [Sphingomonas ginkgonis]|uniref:Lipoprotein n=1 Tax=Sphingomonas ginkgonis TaxID=2315330 RepID=A0A3R9Y6E5_9SPHN|nr:hypothetical protein [Sphingomonas ginkgonis]RST31167.1 hypothetical protein HMF7854_10210 [Sphingomonas ginkgonis]
MKRVPAFAALALLLAGCAGQELGPGYALVRQGRTVAVANGSMLVTAPHEWNRSQRSILDIRWVEDWTLNGPYLDGISFVAGLPDGKTIVRQSKRDDRQVPRFRATMTAPEIASLLETAYRARGGSVEYRTLALAPRAFAGAPGFQLDFEHLDGDELWRKGRAVGAVVGGRLYMVVLDGARSHYFAAAMPDFEAMVESARIR